MITSLFRSVRHHILLVDTGSISRVGCIWYSAQQLATVW